MLEIVVSSLVMATCFLETSYGQNRDVGSEVTFTNLDGSFVEYLPVWLPDSPQGVRLEFRTNQPDALLIYHEYTTEEEGDPPYVIFVQVEDGRIEINHIYLNWKETVRLGRGLMEDTWHSVAYRKDPATRVLTLTVDGETETIPLRTDVDGILDRGPPASTTAVYLGGLPDGHDHRHHVLSRYSQFVGCMRNVQFLVDGLNRTLTPVRRVDIQDTCIDRCQNNRVCQHGGACVNQYYRIICDCYGTGYEGQFCEKSETTEILLKGSNYVEFVQESEVDRLVNRISLQFKTQQQTGTLFFGFGLHPTRNYIMASVQHGYAVFTIDFGDRPLSLTSAARVDDNRWHTLVIMHSGPEVSMAVDSAPAQTLRADGVSFHLRIERAVYFGSVGDHQQLTGIDTVANMIGCMRSVYWNQVSVLEHLSDDTVSHIGGVPDLTCRDQDPVVPFTFPTSETYLSIQSWDPRNVRLAFRFRTLRDFGILGFAPIEIDDVPGKGIWVRLRDGRVHLEVGSSRSDDLVTPIASMPYLSTPGTDVLVVGEGPLNDNAWHTVQVAFVANHAMLEVDGRRVDRDLDGYFTRRGALTIGAGEQHDGIGFVGCMKEIKFNGDDLDVLSMMTTSDNHGIIMDSCNIRDFCGRANRCQHGGLCQQDWYRSWCVCDGTGYEGNVCSFPLYKSSCDEYYQMGERRTGVWRIDVDGRGPLPPAYVHCTMEETEDGIQAGTTTINHNLAPGTVVRRPGMTDTLLHVSYQDMDQYGQTLLHLLQMSQSCQQWVEYQCKAAPLRLGINTWFYGAEEIQYSTFGHPGNSSATDGKCSCWYSNTCAEENLGCNCDKGDETWRTDAGYIRDTAHLPITDAVLLQAGNTVETEGLLSLGPLQCAGSKTDDPSYGVTFTRESSYIELEHGWAEGDLTFSFITYNTSCILLYQQPSATNPNYLLIYMMNGRSVVFLFRVGDIFENITMTSERLLSSGEVQTISIEFEELQVRFTVNMGSRIYDIDRLESFNGFTGPLVLGALPNSMSVVHLEARTGMVGCVTVFKVNGNPIDLRKYVGDLRLRDSSPGVQTGCRHSCDPNPCLFGGRCVDSWEEYTCACADPTAQSGQHCENNINLDSATFLAEGVFLLFEESQNSVLYSGLRFGFRTFAPDAVLLYAHDHLNNFVQLEVRGGEKLTVSFNSGHDITEITVMFTGISSGEWVDVIMSRSGNHLQIAANKTTKSVFSPVNLLQLRDYSQNPFPDHSESIRPERPSAPPAQQTTVYVGGVPASMSSSRRGLLGCMRGLKIGRNDVKSLASLAEKTRGVTSGCVGECDVSPCQHGGFCEEQWTTFKCNCEDTSYTGLLCSEDVGATFSGNTVIHHHANPTVNAYNASLAFVSRQAGVLFHLSSFRSSNAVIISLLPTGQLQLLVDHGSEKDTINTNESLTDGVRHYIRFRGTRDSVSIKVDDLDEMTSSVPAHVMFNEFDVAQLGGFVRTDTHVHVDGFTNFTGCMAGVEINGLPPLEILFKPEEDPLRNLVTISGPINQTTCPGVAQRDMDEVFTFPPWNIGPADTETYSAQAQQGGSSAAAVAVSLCAVVVAVTIGVVCIGRRYRRNRRGGNFVRKKGTAAEMEKLRKPEGSNEDDRPKDTSTIKTNGENSIPLAVMEHDDEKNQLKPTTFKRLPALRDEPDDSSSDSSPENCRKHPALYELDDIDEVPELEWDPQGENARKQEDDYYEDDILALPVVKAIRAEETYGRQQGGGGQYVHPQSHSTPIKGRGRQEYAAVDPPIPDGQLTRDQKGKMSEETPVKSYGHSFV